ncbi:MAG: cytochrome-c peroxidase [Bacteroidota bacterium]
MKQSGKVLLWGMAAVLCTGACSKDDASQSNLEQSGVIEQFGFAIDLNNPANYAGQGVPDYITRDNSRGNAITDLGATLGRVLFYDRNLSVDNTIACASCHQQALAFGDLPAGSRGVNGTTGRHSMRLVNARFGNEARFFWDERAPTLEFQSTQPIQDHIEMGFSGQEGDPGFGDLIVKLEALDYYRDLFTAVYGDAEITEERMQNALAQFVRSIQSFDTKYDRGRARVANDRQPFPNFTAQENRGKQLFLDDAVFNAAGVRVAGGLGCGSCHQAPEFDIDPNSGNNGVITTLADAGVDFSVTRSPTMRDAVKADGSTNGPFMHTGTFPDMGSVMDHYNTITAQGNPGLDPRMRPNGTGQRLAMTPEERQAVIVFMRTLAGNNVYTDPRWSNPFQRGGRDRQR